MVELKYGISSITTTATATLNRTMVELKSLQKRGENWEAKTLNRTMVELK